jgi:hypothetical protein
MICTQAQASKEEICNASIKDETEKYIRFWVAVLKQAMFDSTSTAKNPKARRAKANAIKWLNTKSPDFEMVLRLIGIEEESANISAEKLKGFLCASEKNMAYHYRRPRGIKGKRNL